MLKETLPSSVSLYGDTFLVRVLIRSLTSLIHVPLSDQSGSGGRNIIEKHANKNLMKRRMVIINISIPLPTILYYS